MAKTVALPLSQTAGSQLQHTVEYGEDNWHCFQNVIHSRSGAKRRFWPGDIEAAGNALRNGQ